MRDPQSIGTDEPPASFAHLPRLNAQTRMHAAARKAALTGGAPRRKTRPLQEAEHETVFDAWVNNSRVLEDDEEVEFRFRPDGHLEVLGPPRRREQKEPSPAVKAVQRRENPPRARRFSERLASLLGPIFSPLYDLQMYIGGGVRVIEKRLSLDDYPRRAQSLRLAFLSDLHYGPTSGRVAPRQAFAHAAKSHPDVLLLGGDFLYANEKGLPALQRELRRWKNALPQCKVFACLGNHDHLTDVESLIQTLEKCGVRVLVNEAEPLPAPWEGVYIVGIDDATHGDPQVELALATVPRGACAILLAHSPEICGERGVARCSLILCGDTHGGQICLPSGEAPALRGSWSRQYPSGMQRHAGKDVFVSRGVGTVGLPVRLFAPPDIAVFDVFGNRVAASREVVRPTSSENVENGEDNE